jgi:uncharacterized spore protein YtfJ
VDVKDLLNRAAENISVSRAFGSAYEKDGVLIIPVALVAGGGGGGEGTTSRADSASNAEETEHTDDAHHGGPKTGSGGGFGGVVMPVGAYVVQDKQVRWVPAVNVTVIVVAALFALRFLTKSRVKVQRIKHA